MAGVAIPPQSTALGAWTAPPKRARRMIACFRSRLTARRLGFAVAVSAVVSTQLLFQPFLFVNTTAEYVFLLWLDHFGECLLMGIPLLLAMTIGEVAAEGTSHPVTVAIACVSILLGTVIGALLLIPYYELDWDSALSRRFWTDVAFWSVLGGSAATGYGLQKRAAAAAASLHQAQVDRVALSKQMMEAQLQVMRAQIEPHFLFNTLANVKRLCQTDVEGGIAMLENLVRYLRAALPRMREEETTLGQEADLVQAYLAVFAIRMGRRLRFTITIPAELRPIPFPPMMLLTLAENAIKHGLNPSAHGGRIDITAETVANALVVRLADTGVGFGAAATGGTGVGLANTRARLIALYGDRATLELSANAPRGVVAAIRAPGAMDGSASASPPAALAVSP